MLPLSACNIGGRGGARLGHLCDRCSNDLRAEDSFPSAGYEALKKSSINDASRRPISRRRSEERGGGGFSLAKMTMLWRGKRDTYEKHI